MIFELRPHPRWRWAARCWPPEIDANGLIPLMLPRSLEAYLRHVAVGALLRLGRIVKRTRALPGNAAGLPVVVFVEAAHPAVVIHRHVEMNFVA